MEPLHGNLAVGTTPRARTPEYAKMFFLGLRNAVLRLRRAAVVMQAFIDESGTHRGAARVSVAAVLGANWQWKKFLSHWGNKKFHAKEPRCIPLKHGLFEAIQFSEIECFAAWIDPLVYARHATPHFKTGLGNPYALCTFACAVGVCQYCRANNLGKVAFTIENGQPNLDFVRETLEYMGSKDRYGISSVSVASKNDFAELYPADFLAHSRTSSEDWYQALLGTGRIWEDCITAEKVARMSKQMSEGLKKMRHERQKLKAATIAAKS